MSQDGIPSPIHINPRYTGKLSQETIDLILKESGAESVSIVLFDTKMPCPDRECLAGHRCDIIGNVDTDTVHTVWMQLLKACGNH